jgi:hypothetical protein
MPGESNLSNPGTEATPIYEHVEVGPEFTKWFPELRAIETDINYTVDMLNDAAKLKETTPIYKHVEVGPELTKWFPELRAIETDINYTVDVLNNVAKLKASLDSEEVQRALKLQAEYTTARDKCIAERAGLLATIQGMNYLLHGPAMEIYHQAFDAYDEAKRRSPS